ncbi:MAG: MlaA family lipoprotein [Acidiferrobacter sp.]
MAVGRCWTVAGSVVLMILATGCASVPGRSPVDPLAPMNRQFFDFNRATNRIVMTPVAHAYEDVTPKPLRVSFRNFFRNAAYPNVILNDFLQGRLTQGASDIGRFVVNSTVGVLGLIDVATPLGLTTHDEDAGLTLAHWGVPRGPYLVLPFVGPDTVRNLPNLITGIFGNVLYYIGNAPLAVPLAVLSIINERANASSSLQYVRENAVDAYVFVRDAYLQHRNYLLHRGHLPLKAVEQMMLPPGVSMPSARPRPSDPPPPLRPPRPWPKPAAIVRPPVPSG